MSKSTKKEEIHPEWIAYEKVIESADPVLMILHLHLLTEHYLERIISLLVTRADKILQKGNLTYYQKVILAESLLDADVDRLFQSLKNLNKIRNKCSHELHHKVIMSDIELIGRPFGKDFSIARKDHINNEIDLLIKVLALISSTIVGTIDGLEQVLLKDEEES